MLKNTATGYPERPGPLGRTDSGFGRCASGIATPIIGIMYLKYTHC